MSATWPRCPNGGKTCYPSPAKARKYARKSHHLGAGHPVLSHYKCPSCGAWHLTKQPRP